MKKILGVYAMVLGILGAVLSVIGGGILLNTWWIAFVVLFVIKILTWIGILSITLSLWTVFLVPLGMFVGGWICIGLGVLVGGILASIAE